jgi:hypothetical protein
MSFIEVHKKMKITGKIILTTSVIMILFFLVAPRLWFRAYGETDYMKELSIYLVDRQGYLIGGAIGARDWADENAFLLINQLLKTSPSS